jgi:transcriptional regulator with XRE-family HTH domain
MHRLKQLREQNNWTQQELAERVNMSQRAISNYENNTRDLNTDLIIKLSKLFHCTTDYFLGLVDDPTIQVDPCDKYQTIVYYAKNRDVDIESLKHLIDALVLKHMDK